MCAGLAQRREKPMMEQPPAQQSRRTALTRYQIPTHLNVPDKILSAWGFGITVRQLLILLMAWSAVANSWVRLGALFAMLGTPGVVLHVAAAAIPGIILLFVAFKQIAGRPLEVWLLVFLRYWLQPKVYLWRSIRLGGQIGPQAVEEPEPDSEDGDGDYDPATLQWWQ
jgi:hypothetical protein